MQIAFHIGANCTDEDRLIKSILRNANTLCQQGIAVPGPGKYRVLLRQTIQALNGAPPPPDARDILIDAICEADDIDRIVMSNNNFICTPDRIFENGVFYGQAEPKIRALHQLFAGDEIELFLAIRNPATFLQAVFSRANATSLGGYLGMFHPEDMSWADVVRRIKQAAPDTPLTVWCNEDSPLLWDQLIRQISDAPSDTMLTGGLDLLASIITEDGMAALTEHLRQTPPATDAARHEMIAEIWESHARTDQLEDVIELADLDADLVTRLSENYEDDIAEIAQMAGVTLLMPFS